MTQTNKLSFDEMERVLQRCVESGFKPFSSTQRAKILKEQEERVNASESCYKTSSNQLQRQFSL